MIQRRIRHCAIVTPDGNPHSPCLNDLNRVIECADVLWRTSLDTGISRGAIRLIGRRRFTFVLVGEPRYLDVTELKIPNQALENHEAVWTLDGIVVKMSVSRQNYID